MVNKRASSHSLEDTSGSGESNALAEMCSTMDELHYQNQTWRKKSIISHIDNKNLIPREDRAAGSPTTLKWDMSGACSDPYEHVTSINTQMSIIRAPNSLKCKLLFGTFKDIDLQWYMGIPWASFANYLNLVKKLAHYFTTNCHKKMSTPVCSIYDRVRRSLMKPPSRLFPKTINVFWRHSKMGLRLDTSISLSPRRQNFH